MSKPLKVTVRLAACFLLGVCPASLVSAQDGHIELGTITLNTDRAGGQVLDVPANVTVIDDDEIDDRHITDMEELVRNVPGVTAPRQTTGTDPFSTFGGFVIVYISEERELHAGEIARETVNESCAVPNYHAACECSTCELPAAIVADLLSTWLKR